jgi:competence ComEA-like helix-hairpin-helix protein
VRFAAQPRGPALRNALCFLLFILTVQAAVARASKNPPTHKIDINLASAKELQELPGVGPTTAKAIIQLRTKSGRFHRVEDLLAIRGISETKLSMMRPYVIVSAPSAAPPPAKKPAAPPSTSSSKSSNQPSPQQSQPNNAPAAH